MYVLLWLLMSVRRTETIYVVDSYVSFTSVIDFISSLVWACAAIRAEHTCMSGRSFPVSGLQY